MNRTVTFDGQLLRALEAEWQSIVHEHQELYERPYDPEFYAHHEQRLREYSERWRHFVAGITANLVAAAETVQ